MRSLAGTVFSDIYWGGTRFKANTERKTLLVCIYDTALPYGGLRSLCTGKSATVKCLLSEAGEGRTEALSRTDTDADLSLPPDCGEKRCRNNKSREVFSRNKFKAAIGRFILFPYTAEISPKTIGNGRFRLAILTGLWYTLFKKYGAAVCSAVMADAVFGGTRMMKRQTMENLIDRHKTAYLCSVEADGYPCVKAVEIRGRDGLERFYISTNLSAATTQRLLKNDKASLYFCDARFYRGIVFTGRAAVSADEGLKARLWREGDLRHYPGGISDPDYCALVFTPERGRCHSPKGTDFVMEDVR